MEIYAMAVPSSSTSTGYRVRFRVYGWNGHKRLVSDFTSWRSFIAWLNYAGFDGKLFIQSQAGI